MRVLQVMKKYIKSNYKYIVLFLLAFVLSATAFGQRFIKTETLDSNLESLDANPKTVVQSTDSACDKNCELSQVPSGCESTNCPDSLSSTNNYSKNANSGSNQNNAKKPVTSNTENPEKNNSNYLTVSEQTEDNTMTGSRKTENQTTTCPVLDNETQCPGH